MSTSQAEKKTVVEVRVVDEPVTVVVSEKGWIRALKGHLQDHSTLQFKEGDSLKVAFHGQTTDKIIVFTTGGKAFTLGADKLPGGRGHGEPIRMFIDLEQDAAIDTSSAARYGAPGSSGWSSCASSTPSSTAS